MKLSRSNQTHSRRELFDKARHHTTEALETATTARTNHFLAGRTTHMRNTEKPRESASTKALPTPPSAAIIALNRLGVVFPGYTDYQPLGIVSGTDLPPDYSASGDGLFADDFESGDTGAWSVTSP